MSTPRNQVVGYTHSPIITSLVPLFKALPKDVMHVIVCITWIGRKTLDAIWSEQAHVAAYANEAYNRIRERLPYINESQLQLKDLIDDFWSHLPRTFPILRDGAFPGAIAAALNIVGPKWWDRIIALQPK